MRTTHKIFFDDAKKGMKKLEDESIDLMITSPPYPMIKMWDDMFSEQNKNIEIALKDENETLSFELMHRELDKVWNEVFRVLKRGGIACINVGDATRSINGKFQIFSNHSRILNHCLKIGFHTLPHILWIKETNRPDKFMGSGMLPAGAYVTLEHEYILILRKGGKREFRTQKEKENRRSSAFFWEERNKWFSDKWTNIKGVSQNLNLDDLRERSAAYPFELVYRLINMFSVKGDIVLDPYLGTGTTTLGAMSLGRNSIGFEIEPSFKKIINQRISRIVDFSNEYNKKRVNLHIRFVKEREQQKGELKYKNKFYGFSVMTSQEREIKFNKLVSINNQDNIFKVNYKEFDELN